MLTPIYLPALADIYALLSVMADKALGVSGLAVEGANRLGQDPLFVNRGEQVRARRRALGWSRQVDLGKKAGVSTETVHRIETNKNVETENLDAVLAALDEGERITGRATKTNDQTRKPESDAEVYDRDIERGYKKNYVPVVGEAEASTNGIIMWNNDGVVRGQVEEWVSRAFSDGDPKAYALKVRNDSMVPRYMPGDVVVAQPRLAVRDGNFACVQLKSGERLVKRVFRKDGDYILRSVNELYPDRTVKAVFIDDFKELRGNLSAPAGQPIDS